MFEFEIFWEISLCPAKMTTSIAIFRWNDFDLTLLSLYVYQTSHKTNYSKLLIPKFILMYKACYNEAAIAI